MSTCGYLLVQALLECAFHEKADHPNDACLCTLRGAAVSAFIAFLRGINVGGHNVKMDVLRGQFEALGCVGVETFIASGNVIFESRADAGRLEARVEKQLAKVLGFEVATFIRPRHDLAAVAIHAPFPESEMASAGAFCVGFLKAPLDAAQQAELQRFTTDVDAFATHGRELYWLCRVRQSESKFSNASFERKLGISTTFRSITTVRKLAEKYPAA